jgi:4'-phosphopantetheinyl transferase EntD
VAFEHRFLAATPFGVCAGVSVPAASPTESRRLAELHPDERFFAGELHEGRRATWIAGRLALRDALEAAGLAAPDGILATDRGAPRLPVDVVGSISHKRALAVAMVMPATSPALTIGIDLEEVRPLRVDVADRVLTEAERTELPPLGPARDAQVLRAFCAKEAIYKALDPWVRRFVGFHEAQLAFDGARITARLALARGEGPFAVDLYDASHLVGAEHFLIVAAIGRPVST